MEKMVKSFENDLFEYAKRNWENNTDLLKGEFWDQINRFQLSYKYLFRKHIDW